MKEQGWRFPKSLAQIEDAQSAREGLPGIKALDLTSQREELLVLAYELQFRSAGNVRLSRGRNYLRRRSSNGPAENQGGLQPPRR